MLTGEYLPSFLPFIPSIYSFHLFLPFIPSIIYSFHHLFLPYAPSTFVPFICSFHLLLPFVPSNCSFQLLLPSFVPSIYSFHHLFLPLLCLVTSTCYVSCFVVSSFLPLLTPSPPCHSMGLSHHLVVSIWYHPWITPWHHGITPPS